MDRFINLRLMSNPANWLILFLMVAIAYVGAGYVATAAKNV
jgi:hypothetical protein